MKVCKRVYREMRRRGGRWEVRKPGSQEVRKSGREEGREAGRKVGVGETGGGGPRRLYI